MKKIYSSALIMLLLVSVFTQERVARGQIFEEDQSILSLMMEEFGLDHDATMIDFEKRLVEIHQSDSINDALQQIEHGLATILGGYRSLGRLYRGIICSDLRQYVMLGDAASMTDNIPGNADDRWVFTEFNPGRELRVIPGLAAASRVLKTHNPELSQESLETALALWNHASTIQGNSSQKIIALSELILATGDQAAARIHRA